MGHIRSKVFVKYCCMTFLAFENYDFIDMFKKGFRKKRMLPIEMYHEFKLAVSDLVKLRAFGKFR